MGDILLEKFFEKERWENAIGGGVEKGIDKATLRTLCKPEARAALYVMIRDGLYHVSPPHIAKIPKDEWEVIDGKRVRKYRTVYVNKGTDRILFSILNDLLFETCHDFVHPSCKSYQKGIGCGKVVQHISKVLTDEKGWKADFSKYFDSVPIEYIDKAYDRVEERFGSSALIRMAREYHHNDSYYDEEGNLQHKYQSLKQGCAVASWLADVVLYELDEKLSNLDGYYVRYSDDTLFVGNDYEKAMEIMKEHLASMQMSLNPKKVEYLSADRYFKFLGFSIKGKDITLSKNRLKSFQKEIENRTIGSRSRFDSAKRKVVDYLYYGDGEYSWATQVLPIINVDSDIKKLDEFVLDCLRAVRTGKRKIGGLGYIPSADGCVVRGKGKNVASNRTRTEKEIGNFLSIKCMQNALKCGKEVYEALIRQIR